MVAEGSSSIINPALCGLKGPRMMRPRDPDFHTVLPSQCRDTIPCSQLLREDPRVKPKGGKGVRVTSLRSAILEEKHSWKDSEPADVLFPRSSITDPHEHSLYVISPFRSRSKIKYFQGVISANGVNRSPANQQSSLTPNPPSTLIRSPQKSTMGVWVFPRQLSSISWIYFKIIGELLRLVR